MNTKIIGAGVAGLAAAIRLAHQGHKVDIYELSSGPGGKMNTVQLGEYRFDAGPSLFTMPQYVEEVLAMVDDAPPFNYEKLDVICKYFWNDGVTLSTFSDKDQTIKEIASVLNENEKHVKDHFASSKQKYELTGKTFLEYSLHQYDTWLTGDVAKAMTKLHKLDLSTTMHKANSKRFTNRKTIQLFDRYATYNGSNPYKAPGLLNIIPHFEYGFGAFVPNQGIYQIADTLHRAAVKAGVTFHFESPVEAIEHKNGNVCGIRVNGESIQADTVVSNMDAYYTYLRLLDDQKRAGKILKQERSSSALIYYWGMDRKYEQMDLHNIFFADDYRREFEQIADGKVSKDPTVYVNITSKYIDTDAPKNGENWFVMINVPHHQGQDWQKIANEMKPYIINKLEKNLGVNVRQHIKVESLLTPKQIQDNTFSHTGSLYGTSSNSKFAAFMRHPNFSKSYKNLYFCGGSVHPGGGIPLCLLSAKIVGDLVSKKK